jgi:LEA14-like dessication related protein
MSLALLTIGLSGCATTGQLDPLEVTLVSLEVKETTMFETTMLAKLRVANPNPEPLSLEGATFKLLLEDKKVGRGLSSEIFTIERLSDYVMDVTFYVNNASALLRLPEIIKQESVDYGIRGAFFTEGPFGTKKLKFDKTGTLDLKDFQPESKPEDILNDMAPVPDPSSSLQGQE